MSVKLMGMVLDRFPGDDGETLLALAMADCANDAGEGIYPSLATLARKSRASESTTRRRIKAMLEKGWLIRVNSGGGGRGITNEYRINPDWIKGVSLTGFPDLGADAISGATNALRNPGLEGSGTGENPSTAVPGNQHGNPSNLTPFQSGNPTTAATGFSSERVSTRPGKGATAATPDPLEPKNSDARAHARPGARAPEPDPAARAEGARGYWHRAVIGEFLDTIGGAYAFPEFWRKPIDKLPERLAEMIRDHAAPLVEQCVSRQLRDGIAVKAIDVEMRAAARAAADEVVSIYRSARAA